MFKKIAVSSQQRISTPIEFGQIQRKQNSFYFTNDILFKFNVKQQRSDCS